jgi:hypothetical protein
VNANLKHQWPKILRRSKLLGALPVQLTLLEERFLADDHFLLSAMSTEQTEETAPADHMHSVKPHYEGRPTDLGSYDVKFLQWQAFSCLARLPISLPLVDGAKQQSSAQLRAPKMYAVNRLRNPRENPNFSSSSNRFLRYYIYRCLPVVFILSLCIIH